MNKPLRHQPDDRHKVNASEFLDAVTERRLARAWLDDGDSAARDRLVRAHRPLAVAAAARAGGRGRAPDDDLVQQACLGLLKAADKFDPDRGFRFSTYARWWVRAEIQDYKIRDWSLVRLGNSETVRRLFSNLRHVEADLWASGGAVPERMDDAIAQKLGVDVDQVAFMRQRLGGRDGSLNRKAGGDAGDGGGAEILDLLEDPETDTEGTVAQKLDGKVFWSVVASHLKTLPEREQEIIIASFVSDTPKTLGELGEIYGISRERVRQLREQGIGRLRRALAADTAMADLLP